MRKVARVGGLVRLVRIGRDGKNRYCLHYLVHYVVNGKRERVVLAGGLTKLAAYKMFELLEN